MVQPPTNASEAAPATASLPFLYADQWVRFPTRDFLLLFCSVAEIGAWDRQTDRQKNGQTNERMAALIDSSTVSIVGGGLMSNFDLIIYPGALTLGSGESGPKDQVALQ